MVSIKLLPPYNRDEVRKANQPTEEGKASLRFNGFGAGDRQGDPGGGL